MAMQARKLTDDQAAHRFVQGLKDTLVTNPAIFAHIRSHPNVAWRDAQEELFNKLADSNVWKKITPQMMAQHIARLINCCDADPSTQLYPVTVDDKNKVVQAIAFIARVYPECRDFRRPGTTGPDSMFSAGMQSIFSDPFSWYQNLHVVVAMANQRVWGATPLPPAPPPVLGPGTP